MTPEPEQRLGDFEIVREIGRGGMGIVYEAQQLSLGRRVALKVLGPGLGLTPKAIDRFQREAVAAARLHHTNIVPVYGTGEEAGIYFYSMELIDGPSLDAVIRQKRGGESATDIKTVVAANLAVTGDYLPATITPSPSSIVTQGNSSAEQFDRAAAMAADVADALQHAHQQGVTHRDIKPSNLLLSSSGRLSITDFGLARMLEQPGMTVTGEFVGTPAYMSPEQITAGRIPTDYRTDIYSLGATLYELLTLRPPFSADGRDKLLAMVIQKEPRPPRTVDPNIPRDLETICLKCLEKDPDRRYQSAKELADDLRRFVNRFAILARRPGPLVKAKKWAERNPWIAGLAALVFLAASFAGYFAWQARESEQRRIAEELRRDGEIRLEKRQAAVDRAIIEAMSGDAMAALQAIADAEGKGAESGQLNMLRGLVEQHRGRNKEALVHLEQAERQWPDSVAVKALLATSYQWEYQFQRYSEMLTLADRLEPRTPEDFVFLGRAQAALDPLKGLETLVRAPARVRQSPVARFSRAIMLTYRADETGRVEDAEAAIKAIEQVGLPESTLLMTTQVVALLLAAQGTGLDSQDQKRYQQRAEAIVRELAHYPDVPSAIQGRCLYYYVTGDDNTLLELVRQGKRNVENSGSFEGYEWEVLYRRKQFDEALAVLKTSRSAESRSFRVFQAIVLATLNRTAQAEQLMLKTSDTSPEEVVVGLLSPYFCILGPNARTDPREQARRFLQRFPPHFIGFRGGWYRELLRFNAGQIDESELLAKAGASRCNQCEGYFCIGLHKLSQRKRAEAKEWFTKSVQTGVFPYDEYRISRAFLACIDDPNWLPWLDKK